MTPNQKQKQNTTKQNKYSLAMTPYLNQIRGKRETSMPTEKVTVVYFFIIHTRRKSINVIALKEQRIHCDN